MKDSFDINTIMYKLLAAATIGNNGGIYKNDTRPVDSNKEDIVVNVIAMSTDVCPQTATSNVNIYVPDVSKKIGGKNMLVENTSRLSALSTAVLTALRAANLDGIKIVSTSHLTVDEPSINQHYVNIRVSWNIQID